MTTTEKASAKHNPLLERDRTRRGQALAEAAALRIRRNNAESNGDWAIRLDPGDSIAFSTNTSSNMWLNTSSPVSQVSGIRNRDRYTGAHWEAANIKVSATNPGSNVAPEPSSLALLSIGIVGVAAAGLRRRRRVRNDAN
jgi:hypothetical protein